MALQESYSETLTNVGVKYIQDPNNFKAGKIFPICPVNLQSSQYPTYDKSYWLKNEAAVRKPGTESEGGTHARSFDSYSCIDISYHEDVANEQIENDPNPLNPLKSATRRVTGKIAIYDEVDFATRFMTTGVWTDASNPITKWDAATSVPLEDVDTWKRAMRVATGGFTANKAVMSEKVYDVLKRHDQLKEQIKYTRGGNLNQQLVAEALEVDEIIVMNAVYDAAAYGATADQKYIAGDSFLLLYTPSSPSLEEPSAGYNFSWNGYGQNGYGVRQFDLDREMAQRVEVHHYHDMKQVASDMGTFVAAPLT
jgi:hypothetical protein